MFSERAYCAFSMLIPLESNGVVTVEASTRSCDMNKAIQIHINEGDCTETA